MDRHFRSLPYTIQEYIVRFLPRGTLLELCGTSRYLGGLAATILYASVDLQATRSHIGGGFGMFTVKNVSSARKRQTLFVLALERHPEYRGLVRHLKWERLPVGAGTGGAERRGEREERQEWRILGKLEGLQSLEIEGSGPYASTHGEGRPNRGGDQGRIELERLRKVVLSGPKAIEYLGTICQVAPELEELVLRLGRIERAEEEERTGEELGRASKEIPRGVRELEIEFWGRSDGRLCREIEKMLWRIGSQLDGLRLRVRGRGLTRLDLDWGEWPRLKRLEMEGVVVAEVEGGTGKRTRRRVVKIVDRERDGEDDDEEGGGVPVMLI